MPPVTYASGREWINALPGTTLESKRATAALLAVPRQSQGVRQELVVGEPEALLHYLWCIQHAPFDEVGARPVLLRT